MLKQILTTLTLLLFLFSCNDDSPRDFIYRKGDFWLEDFQNNSLPSKTFYNDKIYCSSIRIGKDSNFLYCLNLKTGKVDWATLVHSWAIQPPIVTDSFIYFCSYLGDIYKLNKEGKVLWKSELPGSFAGFAMDPFNNNLFVKGLESGLYEYDFSNGSIIQQYGAHTMDVSLPHFLKNYMLIGGLKKDTAHVLFGDHLYCFDAVSGKEIWKIKIGEDNEGIFIDDNKLYYVMKNPTTINCINVADGRFLWKHTYGFIGFDPKLFFEKDRILYYETNLGSFHELDKATGELLRELDYYKVRNENRMPPNKRFYAVQANNKKYEILITDSLETPVPYGDVLNIYIKAAKR